MNNKYDVKLNELEEKQLNTNALAISDYLNGLLTDYDNQITLRVEWNLNDSIWGNKRMSISAEKTFRYKGVWGDSEKEWYVKVSGTYGGLSFELDQDFFEHGLSYKQTWILSLLDNWKLIKLRMAEQLEQASETRKIISDFEL